MKAPKSASDTSAAEPIAKPFPMAAVVLPAASRASVFSRTAGGSSTISAMPPALSEIGPDDSVRNTLQVNACKLVPTVDVDGEAGCERGEHAQSRKGDTVHASGLEGDEHDSGKEDHRDDDRLRVVDESTINNKVISRGEDACHHLVAEGEAVDDVGRRASLGRPGNVAHLTHPPSQMPRLLLSPLHKHRRLSCPSQREHTGWYEWEV